MPLILFVAHIRFYPLNNEKERKKIVYNLITKEISLCFLVRQEVDVIHGDPSVVGAKLLGSEITEKVERIRRGIREGKGISNELLKVLMP